MSKGPEVGEASCLKHSSKPAWLWPRKEERELCEFGTKESFG